MDRSTQRSGWDSFGSPRSSATGNALASTGRIFEPCRGSQCHRGDDKKYREELASESTEGESVAETRSAEESMGKLVNRKTDGSGKRLTKTPTPRSKKMSPAGAKVVAAFQEAINVMRSGESLPGRLTVRSFHAEFVRPSYGPEDVRRVRDLLRMSQVLFARSLGSTRTQSARGSRVRALPVRSRDNSWGRSKRIQHIGASGFLIIPSTDPRPL